MNSVLDMPEWMDSPCRMLATPCNNTLYGCNNWGLATANAHILKPKAPELDAPEKYLTH
jgi:hypothetical protein